MAVVLDPRYKKLTFLRRAKRDAVWTALLTAFRAFYDWKHRAGRPTEEKQWDKNTCAEETNTYSVAEWLWIAVLSYYYYYYTLLLIPGFFSVFKQINENKTCLCEVKSLIVLANYGRVIVCSAYWLMQSCDATRSAKSRRNICALYLIEFNRLIGFVFNSNNRSIKF